MKFRICLILVLFYLTLTTCEDCLSMSNNYSCEYYTKCLEPKYTCGSSGYPLGYGFKYCSKFTLHLNEFSPKGKIWVQKTLVCLKQSLMSTFSDCNELYNTAFNSHPRCYQQSGFCDLFMDPSNLKQDVKALMSVYEINDFASFTSLKQILDTSKLCGSHYLSKLRALLKEKFGKKLYNKFLLFEKK
jgi:hypothetical protein